MEGRVREDLLLKHGIGREGKWEGRGKDERKKEREGQQPVLTIQNRSRAPGHAASINLAARLKCYRRHAS